jgi:hypothetical protein
MRYLIGRMLNFKENFKITGSRQENNGRGDFLSREEEGTRIGSKRYLFNYVVRVLTQIFNIVESNGKYVEIIW